MSKTFEKSLAKRSVEELEDLLIEYQEKCQAATNPLMKKGIQRRLQLVEKSLLKLNSPTKVKRLKSCEDTL